MNSLPVIGNAVLFVYNLRACAAIVCGINADSTINVAAWDAQGVPISPTSTRGAHYDQGKLVDRQHVAGEGSWRFVHDAPIAPPAEEPAAFDSNGNPTEGPAGPG